MTRGGCLAMLTVFAVSAAMWVLLILLARWAVTEATR